MRFLIASIEVRSPWMADILSLPIAFWYADSSASLIPTFLPSKASRSNSVFGCLFFIRIDRRRAPFLGPGFFPDSLRLTASTYRPRNWLSFNFVMPFLIFIASSKSSTVGVFGSCVSAFSTIALTWSSSLGKVDTPYFMVNRATRV